MYLEILRILDKYNHNRQLADREFILEIVNIIIYYHKLNNYVTNIYITDDNHGRCNCYSYVYNKLFFNLAKVHDKIAQYIFEDYYHFYNLNVLVVIFHELEHVFQEQIKNSDNNPLLKMILLLSDPTTVLPINSRSKSIIDKAALSYKWKKYSFNYHRNYLKAPEERMAIITSFVDILDIIKLMDSEIETVKLYKKYIVYELDNILKYNYKIDYNFTNSPTVDYLKILYKKQEYAVLKQLENSKRMFNMYEERLFAGLYLTSDEYINLCKNDEAKIKKINSMI